MRTLILSISVAAGIVVFSGNAFARTASCPCNPCRCTPCTCGGSSGGSPKTKSPPHDSHTSKTDVPKTTSRDHGPRDHDRSGHSHGGVGVGIGANIDLSGIGHRTVEPDPFATGGGSQPVAHTQERPKHGKVPPTKTKGIATGQKPTTTEEKPPSSTTTQSAPPKTEEKPTDSKTPDPFEPINKLPPGYYIPAPGSIVPGTELISKVPVPPETAYPTGRPGFGITWDHEHHAWRPPGFHPDPADPDRLFNENTGQNAVWDDEKNGWIDTQTGKPLGYEQ